MSKKPKIYDQTPIDLQKDLVHQRVENGVLWLEGHAPLGWWRNMWDIACPHVTNRPISWGITEPEPRSWIHSSNSVLARAFMSSKEHTNSKGKVTAQSIMRKENLTLEDLENLGFVEDASAYTNERWKQVIRILTKHMGNTPPYGKLPRL